MSDDETFEQMESNSSLTIPVQAGNLKKGDYVCIKGFPCKVVELTTSKTGKHGHAKANITALDVFTGKKYEEVAPTSHNLPQPVVVRLEYQLIDIASDGQLSLMNDANETRDDLKLPEDQVVADTLKTMFEEGKELMVVVMSAMGRECVMGSKVPGGQ